MCVYNRLTALILCAALLLVLPSCIKGNEPFIFTSVGMGTVISLKLYGGDENNAAEICALIDEIERASSLTIEDSALCGLNKTGQTDNLHLIRQAEVCVDVAESSGGAFDCTLGAVSGLWNFGHEDCRVPAEDEIAAAMKYAGYEKLALNDGVLTCGEDQTVDFGAVGKGYACDVIKEYLDASGIQNAVISVGGSLLFYGEKNAGWTVGIKDPFGSGKNIFTFILRQGFVSTSGSYERCFENDGILYHHILSPDSGYPARTGLVSVTVAAESGALSDALSTACFVLGEEKGKELLERYSASGVFIREDGTVNVYGDI